MRDWLSEYRVKAAFLSLPASPLPREAAAAEVDAIVLVSLSQTSQNASF